MMSCGSGGGVRSIDVLVCISIQQSVSFRVVHPWPLSFVFHNWVLIRPHVHSSVPSVLVALATSVVEAAVPGDTITG